MNYSELSDIRQGYLFEITKTGTASKKFTYYMVYGDGEDKK